MVTAIGLRDLQQHASKYVRAVEQGEAEYRVTVHGRDTGVVLTKAAPHETSLGVPLENIGLAPWQTPMSDETKKALLAMIEAGRDAPGIVAG